MAEAASIWVRARYAYTSPDSSRLSFSPGDVMEVLSRSESGWWDAVIGDERGWLPSNYVVVIDEHEAKLALWTMPAMTPTSASPEASPKEELWLPKVQADGKIAIINAATQPHTQLPEVHHITLAKPTRRSADSTATPSLLGKVAFVRTVGTPEPWRKRHTADGRTHHYENADTGEIIWNRPNPPRALSAQTSSTSSASGLDLRTRFRAAEPKTNGRIRESHRAVAAKHAVDHLGSARSSSLPEEISAESMFQCLVERGCPDLTSKMNPERYSKGMVAAGGIGDIHRGELQDGTPVAVKVWRIFEYQTKSLKRATREIYNWSKMDHDNIHKLLGIVMFDGRIGMVSTWMDNGDLQTYIRKNQAINRYLLVCGVIGILQPALKFTKCFQVVKGVRYLHNKGIVHGDLKAVNILVSAEGIPRLTDFDHSVILDGTLMFSQTTQTGGGTSRWMAPELHADEAPCRNKQTDIYALGMTMLEIITGLVPYSECKNDLQVIRKIDRKVTPEQTEHFTQNERGSRMWELLTKCWDHNPELRLTADGVLHSLINLIERTASSTKTRSSQAFW